MKIKEQYLHILKYNCQETPQTETSSSSLGFRKKLYSVRANTENSESDATIYGPSQSAVFDETDLLVNSIEDSYNLVVT